jgi:hypothetical protein
MSAPALLSRVFSPEATLVGGAAYLGAQAGIGSVPGGLPDYGPIFQLLQSLTFGLLGLGGTGNSPLFRQDLGFGGAIFLSGFGHGLSVSPMFATDVGIDALGGLTFYVQQATLVPCE